MAGPNDYLGCIWVSHVLLCVGFLCTMILHPGGLNAVLL